MNASCALANLDALFLAVTAVVKSITFILFPPNAPIRWPMLFMQRHEISFASARGSYRLKEGGLAVSAEHFPTTFDGNPIHHRRWKTIVLSRAENEKTLSNLMFIYVVFILNINIPLVDICTAKSICALPHDLADLLAYDMNLTDTHEQECGAAA